MSKAPKILIVEDERLVAEDLCEILTHFGYEVVGIRARGDDALDYVKRNPVDLVLMDINIQGPMDGVATAEKIRATTGTPLIYVTAFSNDQTIGRARESSAYGFIVKPFQEKSIYAAVEMALGKAANERSEQENEELFRSSFMGLPVGVIVSEDEGKVLFGNHYAEHLTGLTLNRTSNMNLAQFFVPQGRARFSKDEVEPDTVYECRGRIVTTSRKRIPILYAIQPLLDRDESPLGNLLVFQDAEKPLVTEELRRFLEALSQHSFALRKARKSNLLTICAWSKKIKVAEDRWVNFEDFIMEYLGVQVTHGMSPEVAERWRSSDIASARENAGEERAD